MRSAPGFTSSLFTVAKVPTPVPGRAIPREFPPLFVPGEIAVLQTGSSLRLPPNPGCLVRIPTCERSRFTRIDTSAKARLP